MYSISLAKTLLARIQIGVKRIKRREKARRTEREKEEGRKEERERERDTEIISIAQECRRRSL